MVEYAPGLHVPMTQLHQVLQHMATRRPYCHLWSFCLGAEKVTEILYTPISFISIGRNKHKGSHWDCFIVSALARTSMQQVLDKAFHDKMNKEECISILALSAWPPPSDFPCFEAM